MKQELSQTFISNIDDIIEFAGLYDQKLVDAIKWLDGVAQKEGVSFYEKVYEVLYKHDVKERAKDWLKTKGELSKT